jgi:hypothetical protein
MMNTEYLAGIARGAIKTRELFADVAATRGNDAMEANDHDAAYAAYAEVRRHEAAIESYREDPTRVLTK